MKILIITGKGGVGKTSVAAAHAVRSAAEGKNTLLVSADMAHNLGDIFQTRAGGHVKQFAPCLSLLELDPYVLMKEEYRVREPFFSPQDSGPVPERRI